MSRGGVPLDRTQSWEDVRTLREVVPAGAIVWSLDRAGDNALSLGEDVRVGPLSAPERALVALKIAAAAGLPAQSARSFVGLGHFGRRVWFYHHLRPRLDAPTRTFWDLHERDIREGLLGAGRRERSLPAPGPLAPLSPRAPPRARMREAHVREGYLGVWIRTGSFPDPEAGHPWLATGGPTRARAVLVDAPPVDYDVVDFADRLDADDAAAVVRTVRSGTPFVAWLRHPRAIPGLRVDVARSAALQVRDASPWARAVIYGVVD